MQDRVALRLASPRVQRSELPLTNRLPRFLDVAGLRLSAALKGILIQGWMPSSNTRQRLALRIFIDELLLQHQCLREVLLRILEPSQLISGHIVVVVVLVVLGRCYLRSLVYYLDQQTLIFSIDPLRLLLLDL